MIDLVRRYRITVGYVAAIGLLQTERREWSFIAEEISEDDAIWSALRSFRREEMETWNGWPRNVFGVVVEREADA